MVKHSNSARRRSIGAKGWPVAPAGVDVIEPREPDNLGAIVRERRLSMGLTLAALAERVRCAKGYLSQIETGVRENPPSADIIARLELALGFPEGYLAQIAAWHRVPAHMRSEFVEHQRAARRLRQLVERGDTSLDELHHSGELRRLVDRIDPGGASAGGGDESAPGQPRPGQPGPGRSGSIQAVPLPREVPLINSVIAGMPTEFTDLGYPARVADDYVRVPDLADPDAFAARVVGDSMAPDYREGDIVVFSPASELKSGSDCFARLEPDHETTFKRVFFESGEQGDEMIRLQPLNSAYPPQIIPRDRIAGLYRAVTVMRPIQPG